MFFYPIVLSSFWLPLLWLPLTCFQGMVVTLLPPPPSAGDGYLGALHTIFWVAPCSNSAYLIQLILQDESFSIYTRPINMHLGLFLNLLAKRLRQQQT